MWTKIVLSINGKLLYFNEEREREGSRNYSLGREGCTNWKGGSHSML